MKFGIGVLKFQFKVSFSSSKFPIRVPKLGARVNRNDCKVKVGLKLEYFLTFKLVGARFTHRLLTPLLCSMHTLFVLNNAYKCEKWHLKHH